MLKYIPLLVLVLFSSCAPRIYFPDSVNAPAFQQAHEVRAAASFKPHNILNHGGGGNIAHAADIAYAVAPHVGIIASYRDLNRTYSYLYPAVPKFRSSMYTDFTGLLSGHHFDLGAGYFKRLRTKGLFEAYGGYGAGTLAGDSEPQSSSNQHYFDVRYHRYFAIVDAGYRNNKVSITGGMQFTGHSYYAFSADSALYRPQHDNWGFTPLAGQNFFFIQPFMNLEVGYKYIFFNMQFGASGQVSGHSDIAGDSHLYLSFGVAARLAPTSH